MTAKDALLAILSDRVIAYHVTFARVGGGATAGLFLSQLFYWTGKGAKPGGWVWKSAREMEEETGLTKREQQTARKRLKARGLIEEKLAGIPATVHYRVNVEKLIELVNQLVQNAQLADTKEANYSETTHQTTTDHVATATPAPADAEEEPQLGSIGALIDQRERQNCRDCGESEIAESLRQGRCEDCNDEWVRDVMETEVCDDCHRLKATTPDMPFIGECCTCQSEAALTEQFGPRPERPEREPSPHWTEAAQEPFAFWGAESDEFQRQLQRFGDSGRIVQELGYKLEQATGLKPLWNNKKKVKWWSSGLWELYEEAGHSIPVAIEAAKALKSDKKMTVSSPYSFVNVARALAADKSQPAKRIVIR